MERICMYTPSADGGHARYTWELLTALSQHPSAAAMRFELATSVDFDSRYDQGLYPIHRLFPVLRHRQKYASVLAWASSRVTHYWRQQHIFLNWLRQRPDITAVHFQEMTPWLAVSAFKKIRAMGKRVYYTVHNITPHRYPRYVPKAMVDHWIGSSCRLASGLFVHTERLSSQLSDFLGTDHPPIQVIPHGVWHVDDALASPPMGQRLARKRLLFFGQIRSNKGLHILLDAALKLEGYSITIAGDRFEPDYFEREITPRIERLRQMGREIDLQDQFLPDSALPRLFAEHSAIVMPYTPQFQAMSGVIYMALAYEIPVVATAAGGLRDMLEQYHVGEVCADHSPAALEAAIRRLCENDHDQHIAEQMKLARDKYSWSSAASATLVGYARGRQAQVPTHDRSIATNPAH
ncbi:MAG: glycosyltransferase family 4 protein [Phycisphaerales bacterium]|nr:glycosyltransferase family 4 protein [Phycisphaerales bacterium]